MTDVWAVYPSPVKFPHVIRHNYFYKYFEDTLHIAHMPSELSVCVCVCVCVCVLGGGTHNDSKVKTISLFCNV